VSDFTDFRQYAETLVAVYARCGAGPFLHREVAGIVPRLSAPRRPSPPSSTRWSGGWPGGPMP
jgi:hypothetical protein